MDAQTARDLKRAARFVTQDECRRFVTRATYRRLNGRRTNLIGRDGLTGDETAELDALQRETRRLVDTAFPLRMDAM